MAQDARVQEEAQIRRQYQAQIAAAEQKARAEYQKDLAARTAKIRSDYERMIETEKAQYDLEAMISKAAEAERAKFTKSLGVQKKQIETGYRKKVVTTRKTFKRKVQAGIREAKRVAAREAKTYAAVSPRMLRAYRRTEFQMFEEAVEIETGVFTKEVKTWRERAVGEYETGLKKWKVEELGKQEKAMKEWEVAEKATLAKEVAVYKKEAVVGLEAQIKGWKKEEAVKFEPQIKEWREAWQAKGYAEQMLEWKAPDLPRLDVQLFKIPVKGGYLRVGFDVGKFAEGLAEGTVTAAAGIVASGESLAYSIGALAGVKTPRPPPTLIGGLIQSVPESIGAGQIKPSPALEQMSKQKYAFTYAAATLLGDVIISYAIGKGVEKGAAVLGKTRVGAAIGVKLQPVLKPIAKFQYKLGKVTAPVTRRMVKTAEWVISPIYKAKAVSLAAKAPAAVVPRGVLLDLTKPADLVDELTLASRMEARYGSIAAVIPEEQLGAAVQPLDEAIGLTAAEAWTKRAGIELKAFFPEMKPITQLKYGAAFGEPHLPYPKPEKLPSLAKVMLAREKWVVRAVQWKPPTAAEKWAEAAVKHYQLRPISEIEGAISYGRPYFRPEKYVVPKLTLAESLAARRWTVRAIKHQLGAAVVLPSTAEDLAKLPKEFADYVKPLKPTKPPTPTGVEVKVGKQVLIMEKPQLVKPILKVKPEVRVQKWAVRVQKEVLKAPAILKPAEVGLAAMLGVKVVAKTKATLKQELQQAAKQREKQKFKVSLIPIQIPAIAPALKARVAPIQIPELEQPQLGLQEYRQKQLQIQKQREKEEKRLRKKRKKKPLPWKRRGALLEYPVRPEKEVPSFIFEGLGKTTTRKDKGMNLSNAIFGKGRKKK